jgi:hypothetical protein
MAKPSSTPATVAWIPEACTSAQVITPRGNRISHAAGALCQRSAVFLDQEGVQRQRNEGQQQRAGLDVAGGTRTAPLEIRHSAEDIPNPARSYACTTGSEPPGVDTVHSLF